MKGVKYMICLFGLLAAFFSCETSTDEAYKNYFIKYYGGDGNQEAKDFVVNDDGTVIMIGTSTEVNDTTRIYVVKADAEGNTLWSKKWGGKDKEFAQDLEPILEGTYAGGFLLLSNVEKDNDRNTLIKVLRFDADGNKIDSLAYNQYSTQFGYSITSMSDGGFVFTGNTTDISAFPESDEDNDLFEDKQDLILARFTENKIRDNVWILFGGEEFVMGVKVLRVGASGYYFAGHSNTARARPTGDFRQQNFWYAKLSPSGTFERQFFGGSNRLNESLTAITNNSSTYMGVGTQLVQVNQTRIYVHAFAQPITSIKLDTLLGGQNVGPENSEGVSITSAQESNTFWVVGNEIKEGGRNIWVGKVSFDPSSALPTDAYETETFMSFGGANNDDTASAVKQLPNGDVLILGTMELVHQKKMALIKVRPNGHFE